jgi:hypothetical protein
MIWNMVKRLPVKVPKRSGRAALKNWAATME